MRDLDINQTQSQFPTIRHSYQPSIKSNYERVFQIGVHRTDALVDNIRIDLMTGAIVRYTGISNSSEPHPTRNPQLIELNESDIKWDQLHAMMHQRKDAPNSPVTSVKIYFMEPGQWISWEEHVELTDEQLFGIAAIELSKSLDLPIYGIGRKVASAGWYILHQTSPHIQGNWGDGSLLKTGACSDVVYCAHADVSSIQWFRHVDAFMQRVGVSVYGPLLAAIAIPFTSRKKSPSMLNGYTITALAQGDDARNLVMNLLDSDHTTRIVDLDSAQGHVLLGDDRENLLRAFEIRNDDILAQIMYLCFINTSDRSFIYYTGREVIEVSSTDMCSNERLPTASNLRAVYDQLSDHPILFSKIMVFIGETLTEIKPQLDTPVELKYLQWLSARDAELFPALLHRSNAILDKTSTANHCVLYFDRADGRHRVTITHEGIVTITKINKPNNGNKEMPTQQRTEDHIGTYPDPRANNRDPRHSRPMNFQPSNEYYPFTPRPTILTTITQHSTEIPHHPSLDKTIAVTPYASAVNDSINDYVNKALGFNLSKDALDVIVRTLIIQTGQISRIAITLSHIVLLSEYLDDNANVEGIPVNDASRLLGSIRTIFTDEETSINTKLHLCEIVDRIIGCGIVNSEEALFETTSTILQYGLEISVMCDKLKIKQPVTKPESWWSRLKSRITNG